jgi:hypothetical protein
MRMPIARACLVLAVGVTLIAFSSPLALASSGPRMYSADQVGYALTGAQFTGTGIGIRLPAASQYAAEAGEVAVSLQLWGRHSVVDLTLEACTDHTCRPGGTPESFRYRLNLSVYSRYTQALICSTTAASPSQRCENGVTGWNSARFKPGTSVLLTLDYNYAGPDIMASANQFRAVVSVNPIGTVTQARIVVQFGSTPFSQALYRRPGKTMLLATLGTYWSELNLAGGRTAYIGSSLFARHEITMTRKGVAAPAEATASAVYDSGAYFRVYLDH